MYKITFKYCLFFCFFMAFSLKSFSDIFDWKGGTSTDITITANWNHTSGTSNSTGLPKSTDAVRIGVNNSSPFTYPEYTMAFLPIITASTSWSSLEIGWQGYQGSTTSPLGSSGGVYTTLTVNTPAILTVAAVTIDNNPSTNYGTAYAVNNFAKFILAGTGTLTCSGVFNAGDATTQPAQSATSITQISMQIKQATISGTVTLNSNGNNLGFSANYGICYPWFQVDGGTTTLAGKVTLAKNNGALANVVQYRTGLSICPGYGQFIADNTSSAANTLELKYKAPFDKIDGFYVFMEYGGKKGTVIYDDPNNETQTVYTANEPSATTSQAYINTTNPVYYNLTLSGASPKTVDGNSSIGTATPGLTIGGNWVTSGTSGGGGFVNLNSNNPTVAVTGNWTNSIAVTEGTGAVTITGNASTSTANYANINGSTTGGNMTVTGTFSNGNSLTCNAENIILNGIVTNTGFVTGGSGTLTCNSAFNNTGIVGAGSGTETFNGVFTNSALSSFKADAGAVYFKSSFNNSSALGNNVGSFFFAGSGPVYFSANYNNSGAFSAGTGTVYFNGTAAQTLTDNGWGTAFNNVTFNGGNTCTIVPTNNLGNFYVNPLFSLSVTNSTTLTVNATKDIYSGLTLVSDSTGDASISDLTRGTITGQVDVERFLTGGTGYRGYRLLSSPVNISNNTKGSGYLGLNYIRNNRYFNQYGAVTTIPGAFTGGPGGSSNGFTYNNANPTIYLYDESKPTNNATYVGGKNIGVTAITATTINTLSGTITSTGVNIPVGNGYFLYFIGDNTRATPSSAKAANSTTITSYGTPNQGNVLVYLWNTPASQSLSYTSTDPRPGINQVGNPYASAINLDKLYTDNYSTANPITANFYEMNEPGQNYISYNASSHYTSNNRAGKYIASGQGFMMVASGSGQTLTFMEDQKISSTLTQASTPALLMALKPTKSTDDAGLHLQLTKDNNTNTQTGIYFNSTTADTYNINDDAKDMDGVSPQVYLSSFSTDGVRLGINSMGDYIKGKRVKLFVKATASAQYNLKLADIKNIDTIYNVLLVDKLLKDSVDLRTSDYNFNINTADTTTFGGYRFELAVELKVLPDYKLVSFTGKKTNAGVQLNWTTLNEGYYTGFVLQKQTGTTYTGIDSLQSSGSGSYSYLDDNAAIGLNTYRLKQIDAAGNITYSALVNVNTNTEGTVLTVYPNPARESVSVNVNLAATAYIISIYNSLGAIIKQIPISSNKWTGNVASYNPGTYIIEVNDKKGNFVGKTKFVKIQ